MATEDKCMICGRASIDHHRFSPRPPGCVCAGGWGDSCDVPTPCSSFRTGAGMGPHLCGKCLHDKECHGKAAP